MPTIELVRAWKDVDYREDLTAWELEFLADNPNPAGDLDAELYEVETPKLTACTTCCSNFTRQPCCC